MIPLSEAILLGSTLLRPSDGGAGDGVTYGCALQMALVAIGENEAAHSGPEHSFRPGAFHPNYRMCEELWGSKNQRFISRVHHLYDMGQVYGQFSMDKFIDQVRSIEPPEQSTVEAQLPNLTREMVLATVSA